MKKRISIKKNADFKRAISKGNWGAGQVLSIHLMQNAYTDNRIGISVSKKIGNSVKRNRIKRLVREVYRSINITDKMKSKIRYDVVVIAKTKSMFEEFTYKSVEKDIMRIFNKLGLI